MPKIQEQRALVKPEIKSEGKQKKKKNIDQQKETLYSVHKPIN